MSTLPRRGVLLVLGCLAAVCALRAAPDGGAGGEPSRWDWYFRESLAAIRDWEAVLTRWDKQIPASNPVFPVPGTGAPAVWPNPIPWTLLPEEDRKAVVNLACLQAGTIQGERRAPDRAPVREIVQPGGVFAAYQHPGGGGKDQWYHHYERKFDRLTRFQPQLAGFAVEMAAPFDFRLGRNEMAVVLRGAAKAPLQATARLQLFTPAEQRDCGEQRVAIEPGVALTIRFPVELRAPGGGVLVLTLEADGKSYWMPFLTQVENLPAVLASIEQILADAPDGKASGLLESLRQRAAGAAAWRAVFEEASQLREDLLLRRIDFDSLLFVKRKPFFSEQPFMDAHHCYNRPGGGIYRLSPVRPDGKVTPVVDSLGEGIYRDLCLDWEARRLLFAFGNGADRGAPPGQAITCYHIHEASLDKAGSRQITQGPKNDCEPFYFPDGRIGFTSDRSEQYVMCGSNIHVANLFVMNADGSGLRQFGHNVFNEFNPSILPDGRIIYDRWEYNERSVTSLHKLFTVHTDGTHVAPYYGNATIRPNVIMFPRAVPGSSKVMALFTAHHGQTHGPIGLIDVGRGVDGDDPVTLLTPGVPVTGEKAEDSRYGWYSDPVPLSETTYLCSFTPTVVPWLERSWGLYVGDRHGNLALVYRDPGISCAEPVPVVTRQCPPRHSRVAGDSSAEARLLVVDVARGLAGVPAGAAKFLRIIEDVPRKEVPEGGVIVTAATKIYTVKRILGTVPVEADGSAYFAVPAGRNVYFEVLDGEQREIQRMRSVVTLEAGETRTCVGCHEPRQTAPPNLALLAARHEPSRPARPPWGDRTLSFARDLQPLIDAKCVNCHAYDRPANGVILTGDLTDQFSIAYEELVPFIHAANAMRWDHPDDVHPRPPYTFGSTSSPLARMLEAGHHGVRLAAEEFQRLRLWIDANGVYYDRYESTYPGRKLFTGAAAGALRGAYNRRCALCHGQDSAGQQDSWWLSLNRQDVKASRALQAPLARSAGGWQRCGEVVFASAADPDYQTMLASLAAIRDRLARQPREDVLSIQGTVAERQVVALPPPPTPVTKKPDAGVYLSALPWSDARAGWTPNRDGLPRRDRDIENKPLCLGGKVYRKGLGTHAPSEIRYALNGAYTRLEATIGAPEANGSVVFQVFADEQKLFDSGILRGLEAPRALSVPLAGARTLRLVVTDAGDGYFCDEANWAEARLSK